MAQSTKRVGTIFGIWCAALQLIGSQVAAADDFRWRCTPPPQGLVSWWPGDGNANDIVGPNSGQLLGGAGFAPGFVGRAFDFDGITSYVQATSANLPVGGADRTLEMWVRLESVAPRENPAVSYFESFFAGYGSFANSYQAFVLLAEYQPPYGNVLAWSPWQDQLAGPQLSPAGPFPFNGGWHHVAVTSTNSNNVGVVLFLDGLPVARRQGFSTNTASNTPFYMGRIPGSLGDIRRLHGQLDEVSVYSRVLSPGEIRAIFEAGQAGKCKH
jgi:hypothetical protein